jgi:hypothetical protein
MKGEWLRRPASARGVVFVHGMLSRHDTSWRHDNGTYWPELLAAEPNLDAIGIYVFTYQTNFFSGTYRLGNVVDALKEHLRLDGVLDLRDIVFVCHSMGGIVVRKYVVERAQDLIERNITIGLFLIASPSLGSQYANWLAALAQLVDHSQADALRFGQHNAWLRDLDKEFQNLKEGGRLRIRGKELVEDKFIALRGFWRQPVVEEFSAARYFGESYKVPGSDHLSIARPPDRETIQHRLLREIVASGPHHEARVGWRAGTPKPPVQPTKKHALLDRRLVSDLLVAFAGIGWDALEAEVQASIFYGLTHYDQLLVENAYASTLHHNLLANMAAPKALRDAIVVTTPVRFDPFLVDVMSEAGELFAVEPRFALSVSQYEKSRSGGTGAPSTDIAYLLHSLRVAGAFDAAILPHPLRWPLYRTCFEICANREDPRFSDTATSLPEIRELFASAGLDEELRRVVSISRESPVSMELRQFGPCAFPYPKALLDTYEKTDLEELRMVTFELCVPRM